jgi:tripartite ATP-independent transporter DctP family solute receptor
MPLTRRSFLAATSASLTVFSRSLRGQARDVEFTFRQYHNQTPASSLHTRLVQMWEAVYKESGGRLVCKVFAQNNGIQGSDPAALKALVAGEIEFFTLMGGVLDRVVPTTSVQDMPFAFRSAEHAHHAMDGPLGAYLREEMEAHGVHGFAVGAFDNGMRQISIAQRPVVVPADLIGIRMRTPDAPLIADTFRAFGAEPVTVNSADIYAALKSGKVDAQENPLALIELFKLYEVVRYISVTNHIWSGFNELAHLPTWKRLPDDIKGVIERNVAKHARLQRQEQTALNARLRTELAQQGPIFNDVDQGPFKRQLGPVYAKWKKALGTRCWSLLEAETGRLA